MRNLNLLKNPFVRAAAISCSAFFLAAPMHNNIDPSLLAAEPYNPELWNGEISNEFLINTYNQNRHLIDKIISTEKIIVPHDGHRALDMPLILATHFATMRREYKGSEMDFINALSIQYQVPTYAVISLDSDLRKISSHLEYQDDANCYSYSVNDHNNTSYGVATGTRGWNEDDVSRAPIFQYTDAKYYRQFIRATIEGATQDGLIFTGTEQATRPGFYRVALLTSMASPSGNAYNDYHWARQNRDGTWSHKMASLNVTNIDFGGNRITEVTRANFGEYKFVGYFLVPRSGIDVGPIHSQATDSSIDIVVTARREPT